MKYRNILLVDDDADEAEIFGMALDAVDPTIKYSVEDNALEALKMLRAVKKNPDIIFLDYHMPYLDGEEFIKLLREIEGMKKVPVVLYSGHSGTLARDAASRFKRVQFLKKKSSLKELCASLYTLLEKPTALK